MGKNSDQTAHMNKDSLIISISEFSGLSKKDASKALDGFIQSITKGLKDGKSVNIVGFGSFNVIERPEGIGRNPRTGETIKIKAAKLPKFRAGKNLKEAVL